MLATVVHLLLPAIDHARRRPGARITGVYGDAEGYSSGDNGGGSVTSSRRSTKEVVNS